MWDVMYSTTVLNHTEVVVGGESCRRVGEMVGARSRGGGRGRSHPCHANYYLVWTPWSLARFIVGNALVARI